MKISRREFLKGAAVAGVGMALPLKFGVRDSHAFYQGPGLQKWQTTLRGVETIPVAAPDAFGAPVTGVKHYTIDIKEFIDQLYPTTIGGNPTNFGPTKLWGFQPANFLVQGVTTQRHLGGIIVAQRGEPIQITFRNKLTDTKLPSGIPLKGIIPVDTTIPGANQAQNRIAIHLHGGLIPWISDGGPFDWWAPNGTHGMSFLNNLVLNPEADPNEAEYYYGNNQSARMVWYHDHAFGITRTNAYAGVASVYIIRDAFELSLVNLGTQPGLAGLPKYIEAGGYELPIVIQDKIFVGSNINALDPTWVSKGLPSTPGSLWYPHVYEKNRWKLIGAGSRLPNPSVIAEMFGDTMLVNGTVYPEVPVEPRRYRLRILNACNARFLNLQLLVANYGTPAAPNPDGVNIVNGVATNAAGPDWLVLGNEAGFLQNPALITPSNTPFSLDSTGIVPQGTLITGNAERWDVLVDFSAFAGQDIILYTDAPAPFPFGDDRNDYYFNNPLNPVGPSQRGYGPDTRVLMRFKVGMTASTPADETLQVTPGTDLKPGIDPFLATLDGNGGFTSVPVTTTRKLTLNEAFDAYGRLIQMLGTNVVKTPGKFGRAYLDQVTENPTNGDVEIWEIFNLTGDTHPIHFHLVNVQVLNREPFDPASFTGATYNSLGPPRPPDPTELGWKETVRMNPNEVTRVIMKFELPKITGPDGVTPIDLTSKGGGLGTPPLSPRTGGNEYVWHCHILEHEEHDMMRPLVVT
jgi:spore coat protein A, manganese oxidase